MTIKTRNIADGAVTTAKLASGAVTGAALANQSPAAANNGTTAPSLVSVVRYSFAVDGDAATVTPATNVTFPTNSVIYGLLLNVITIPVGPTNVSVGLSAGGAGTAALVASAAISGAPWSTTGIKAGVPVWTAAAAIKLSAPGVVTVTRTVAAFTAGIFEVIVFWANGTA